MNWEAVGAVGEIVGAIAVVATLFYLAAQIRQNSKIVDENSRQLRLSTVDATLEAFARYRALLSQPHIADIYVKGVQGTSELTEAEKLQFGIVLDEYLFSYWSVYRRVGESAYDESDWDAHLNALSQVLRQPGVAEWWAERKRSFPPAFVDSIESTLG